MADILKTGAKGLPFPHFSHSSPYGNATSLPYDLVTVAGVATPSDKATVVADGDVVILGVLPAGMRLDSLSAKVSAAFTALTTFKLGFRYVDGVNSDAVNEDDDYFTADLSGTTLGSSVNGLAKTVIIPKDAYLIATVTTLQTAGESGVLEAVVNGVLTGAGDTE